MLDALDRDFQAARQTFRQPFRDARQTPQQQTNAHHYVQGLLAELGSKDVVGLAVSSDVGLAGNLVADAAEQAGKKCRRRR